MHRLRILIVDDDPNVRLTLPDALMAVATWLDVRAVNGVLAAWGVIGSQWTPDVVLLDACMPLVDGDSVRGPSAGLRFLEEKRVRAPDLAVIMHSGSDTWREACFRHGAADYVVKPIAPVDLARVIRRVTQPS